LTNLVHDGASLRQVAVWRRPVAVWQIPGLVLENAGSRG
jgi:hypothetical protein